MNRSVRTDHLPETAQSAVLARAESETETVSAATRRHASDGLVMVTGLLPGHAVFAGDFVRLEDGVGVVTRAAAGWDADPAIVHVGARFAPAAVHRAEVHAAGVVHLTDGAAGTTAAGHLVRIGL